VELIGAKPLLFEAITVPLAPAGLAELAKEYTNKLR
jgi:hypothetical protein